MQNIFHLIAEHSGFMKYSLNKRDEIIRIRRLHPQQRGKIISPSKDVSCV